MAHATTHAHDFTPEEAIREIKSERTRRGYIALILFVLSGAALVASFFLSYQGVPAPTTPANRTPALMEPYH